MIVCLSIISEIDERLIKFPPVVSATLFVVNSMSCFFIYYLCNRWDANQSSLWLMPCEINHLAWCLIAVFKYLCDLRATGSFHVWPSSAIISLIWVIFSVTCLLVCDMFHWIGDYLFSNLNMSPYSRLNLKKVPGFDVIAILLHMIYIYIAVIEELRYCFWAHINELRNYSLTTHNSENSLFAV